MLHGNLAVRYLGHGLVQSMIDVIVYGQALNVIERFRFPFLSLQITSKFLWQVYIYHKLRIHNM